MLYLLRHLDLNFRGREAFSFSALSQLLGVVAPPYFTLPIEFVFIFTIQSLITSNDSCSNCCVAYLAEA